MKGAKQSRENAKNYDQDERERNDGRDGNEKEKYEFASHAQTLRRAFTMRNRMAPHPGSRPLRIPVTMATMSPKSSIGGANTMLGSNPFKAFCQAWNRKHRKSPCPIHRQSKQW